MHQKVIIIGNLGGDPEMRFMPNGDAVTNFSVATNRKWKNKDGSQGEETTWFKISAWRGLAETCNKYLSKGKQVYIEGRMAVDKATGGPRVWTAQDGTPRSNFEINADTVRFLGGGGTNQGQTQNAPVTPQASSTQDEFGIPPIEEEIPF